MPSAMFFTLSKALWAVAAPSNALLLILIAGGALLWTSWRRLGRWLVTAVAAAATLIATLPVGEGLLLVLENRFPSPPALPDDVAGIIVLGGAVQPDISTARRQASLNDAAERITAAVALAGRYADAPVVYTGGSARLWLDRTVKEATFAGPLLTGLGLPPDRLVLEDQSRNTHENVLFTQTLMDPQPDQVWLVVTSAFHMPRSVGLFRAAGWEVLPYPVDYRVATPVRWWVPTLKLGHGLTLLDMAVREWIGLAAYRITGRTEAFFPSPEG
ncbi:MAG: YdcF family protein [Rhodospirillales bacterium]|nr:MAG: YdcF family protein [Rhodospirillales bacterium]